MAKKEAALNTIGYICEEIADLETDCLQACMMLAFAIKATFNLCFNCQAKSNEILTAVVAGMRAEETVADCANPDNSGIALATELLRTGSKR